MNSKDLKNKKFHMGAYVGGYISYDHEIDRGTYVTGDIICYANWDKYLLEKGNVQILVRHPLEHRGSRPWIKAKDFIASKQTVRNILS